MDAFTIERYDHCPMCNGDKVIELYDIYDNPVRLTALINMDNLGRLNNRKLSYMKCKQCDTRFELDWEFGDECPYPLTKYKMKDFLNRYKAVGDKYLK